MKFKNTFAPPPEAILSSGMPAIQVAKAVSRQGPLIPPDQTRFFFSLSRRRFRVHACFPARLPRLVNAGPLWRLVLSANDQ